MSPRTILGRYLQLTALLQLANYALIVVDHANDVLFVVDPRVAVTAAAEMFLSWRNHPPAIAWISALAFLGLGEAIARRRWGLTVYALVQIAYIVLFAIVATRYVSESLRISGGRYPGELLVPSIEFAATSIVPLLASAWIWRWQTSGAQPKRAVA